MLIQKEQNLHNKAVYYYSTIITVLLHYYYGTMTTVLLLYHVRMVRGSKAVSFVSKWRELAIKPA